MGGSLMQQRRVSDEGLMGCKALSLGKKGIFVEQRYLMVPREEAPANFVPAAAVIRRVRALFGMIGRKVFVGGFISHM
jgi:hypothetical protein